MKKLEDDKSKLEPEGLEKFDQMVMYIYKFFTDKWNKNLSMENLKKAVRDTFIEINEFKIKQSENE